MLFKLPRIIKRIITIFVGFVIVFLIVAGFFAFFINSKKPPSLEDAPWIVQTSSRIYYAHEFTIQDGIQKIRGFWYSNGGRWIYDSGTLTFPENIYGSIKVIRRTTK